MVKRLFRPLGSRLQRFARLRINNFAPITNMASRTAIAPTWEEAVDEPLVWQAPAGAAPPTPEPEPETDFEPTVEPGVDSAPRRTPPDLALILELHEERRREAGVAEPPSPFRDAGTSSPAVPGAPVQQQPARHVQRREAPATAPPRSTPPQRRGRVISEITPSGPSAELPPLDEPAAEPAPEWESEPEYEPTPDRPDLAEALISAGMMDAPQPVQREPQPPAEQQPPRRRHRAKIEYESTSALNPDAPVQRQESAPVASDEVQDEPAPPESPASPPTISPNETLPPTPPLQRQPATPAVPATDTESYDLSPASGTAEADMLDILGLPPDTPVVGLDPAVAQPARSPERPPPPSSMSDTQPSASVTPAPESTDPPAVERPAESPVNPPLAPPSEASVAPTPPAQRPVTSPQPVQRQSPAPDEIASDSDDGADEYVDSSPDSEAPPAPPVQRRTIVDNVPNQPASVEPPLPETTPADQPEATPIQRQAAAPTPPSAPTPIGDVPPIPSTDEPQSPPPPEQQFQAAPSPEPIADDFEDYDSGDTRPIETLRDVEPLPEPPAPGYHIETPPTIAEQASPGQISRIMPPDTTGVGGGKGVSDVPASPAPFTPAFPVSDPNTQAGSLKIGTPSPTTKTTESTPPPMGGKLGGKLGNDTMPGKTSAESPPGGMENPNEGSSDESPAGEMSPEAEELLESLGFDTDPFGGESNPDAGDDATADSPLAALLSDDNEDEAAASDPETGDAATEGDGEAGDEPSTAEDAAEDSGINVDKLAQDVFSVLRDRLRIEQERRSTR